MDVWNKLTYWLTQQKYIKSFSLSSIIEDDEGHLKVVKLLLICTMLNGSAKTCEFWHDEELIEFLEMEVECNYEET